MRLEEYMALVGGEEICEGGRPLGKPRHRWEGNIKMDLSEVGYGVWTELIWLKGRWRALVNAVMNFRVP
jgi:hypothetical protein